MKRTVLTLGLLTLIISDQFSPHPCPSSPSWVLSEASSCHLHNLKPRINQYRCIFVLHSEGPNLLISIGNQSDRSLLFFSTWPGSGAPLSRYREGALYKF